MRIFLSILTLLLIPFGAYAHGGVEKQVGNVEVSVDQTPLSPFVGERVHLPFVFTDSTTHTPLTNLPVTVSVIDTFFGDESKDTIMSTQERTTDINGVLDFSYTFEKENYFDVELRFKDKKGVEQETGFLIQARNIPQQSPTPRSIVFFIVGIVCAVIGYLAHRKR